MKFLKEGDKAAVKNIDAKVKNKWSWKWVEETLSRDILKVGPVRYKLGDCIAKIDVAGVAFCKWCEDKITYSGNGKKHLISHCNTEKHVEKLKTRATNYQLGGVGDTSESTKLFPLFKPRSNVLKSQTSDKTFEGSGNIAGPSSAEDIPLDPLVPISDRIVNSEAMILAFIAEHSLPISLADPLSNLIKEASVDPKSLSKLNLSKTSAAYKMNFGLAKTFSEFIVAQLKTVAFSLNIDEATDDHGKKSLVPDCQLLQ